MNRLIRILMERDNLTKQEAIEWCLEYDTEGDPEEFLLDEMGLEPDYVFDLLDVIEINGSMPIRD